MNWGSFEAFLAMGGYALNVWGSYVVTILLIIAEIVLLALRRRGIVAQLGGGAGRASRRSS